MVWFTDLPEIILSLGFCRSGRQTCFQRHINWEQAISNSLYWKILDGIIQHYEYLFGAKILEMSLCNPVQIKIFGIDWLQYRSISESVFTNWLQKRIPYHSIKWQTPFGWSLPSKSFQFNQTLWFLSESVTAITKYLWYYRFKVWISVFDMVRPSLLTDSFFN